MSDVDDKLTKFLADLDRVWPSGYSAVLFGSAARGQYLPGWSDINVLLIADRLTPAALREAREALSRWRVSAEALPLLFGKEEWLRSADAYPLEIAEMRTGYKVLRGADPLSGMTVRPDDLRAALEREFRGKLMRLRQGYALFAPESDELTEFVRSSASSVLLLCRGLLVLTGDPVPAEAPAVVVAAGTRAGFAPDAIIRIIAARSNQGWRAAEEDVQGYLAAVEAAARFVDHFQIGART
jgi:predicted nucleotidyltransferase